MKPWITGLLTGAASGLLGALAFPPAGLWFLAWIALVPLFLHVRATGGRRTVLPFLFFAFVHFSIGLSWLAPVIAPIGVVLFAAVIWLFVFLPMSLTIGFLIRRGLPLILVAPVVWVAFDWTRTWLLTGLPWLYLAHSQADRLLLIQISDVTGAWGITALIVFVNACVAAVVALVRGEAPRRACVPAAAAVGAVVLVVVYGAVRIGTIASVDGPGVLLVQACIPQGDKRELRERARAGADLAEKILVRHLRLTREGVTTHPETAVVIWPETMFPYRIDDGKDVGAWRRREVEDRIRAIDRAAGGRPVIFGALFRSEDGQARNSVFMTDGNGRCVARYDKRHTVPGGEYVPFHTVAPPGLTKWVGETIARFAGYYPDLTEGEGPVVLAAGGVRFAPLICYEIMYPALVTSTMGLEPGVLLNLSNYAWYPDTHQPEQAEDITVFRAVENRRPVVVSANNGISSIIDARGVVRTSLAKDVEGALFGRVPNTASGALYARWGDFFAWLAAAGVVLLFAGAVYCGRRCDNPPGGRT